MQMTNVLNIFFIIELFIYRKCGISLRENGHRRLCIYSQAMLIRYTAYQINAFVSIGYEIENCLSVLQWYPSKPDTTIPLFQFHLFFRNLSSSTRLCEFCSCPAFSVHYGCMCGHLCGCRRCRYWYKDHTTHHMWYQHRWAQYVQ